MKPSREDVGQAVLVMAALNIPGFPSPGAGHLMLTKIIWEMVGSREQLEWLRDTVCTRMRRFSVPEMRGIFCTRYRPADGIECEAVETPGFTPADQERLYLEREREEDAARLAAYRRESKQLGEAPVPGMLLIAAAASAAPPRGKPRLVPKPKPEQSARELEEELKREMDRARKRSDQEKARIIADLEAQLKKDQ